MSLKLSLDGEAKEAVTEMLKTLKTERPEVSVTPSSLAGWIILYFFKKGFKQSKLKIADSHFNPKAYIRLQLKDLNSVEKVEAALLEIRSKMKNTKEHSERKNDGEPGPTGT